MKIYLVCSKAFYKKLNEVKSELESMGHIISIPFTSDSPETEAEYRGTDKHANWKSEMIKRSESVISNVDAVLVLNYEKNGIKNYIGGATFLEIYDAFRLNKQIYMMNDIPDSLIKDELNAFSPIILHEDLSKLKNI